MLHLRICSTAGEKVVLLQKQNTSPCQRDSDIRYLKKDLVAHCETSLSQAALEQARISAVAHACSSLTENSHSSRHIQVRHNDGEEESIAQIPCAA